MLSIRLQRLGRKGYPVYRIAVQEAQRHPSSGRVVAYVGSYNPHTKQVRFDKEKTELYLKNGAQPSPHVIKLMVQEKIAMPSWVKAQGKKDKKLRNPDKLRKNQPEAPKEETPAAAAPDEAPAEEGPTEEAAVEEASPTEKVEETDKVVSKPEEPAKTTDKTT
jgi:small subunit ribosomal protein S16